jgi:hypothetical protein
MSHSKNVAKENKHRVRKKKWKSQIT